MKTRARLAAVLAPICAASASHALTIEYALDRPAALVACDERLYRGARTESDTCYRKLLAENTDPRIKGDAARALGDSREANSWFQAAIKQFPDDAALRTRWGELFIATHQNNEAIKLFQEALERDADYAPAKIGLAKIAAGQFDEKTREWAQQVIDESPDDALEAHLLLARAALEDGALDDGEDELDAALELAEDNDRSPLEVYALKASLDLLRNTTESPWTARALALNPSFGGAYATPAHFYVITRRYREAIGLLRKAVEVEPDLYSAHAELGLNLLRENKLEEAQRHLEVAYRGDPFSAPIVNTLRLVDSFDNFVVSQHPAKPKAPGSNDAHNPGSILRLHKDEAAVLEPYVLDLVNRTIDTYSKRYGFELKEPVIVELYPDHDDFAVRIAGLPGIGLLGVTFGYLVAMDSPTGRADADFHWGTTLWHEMAHVFTLEATNHLVPRWFSEGVSVFEEWSTGPLPGRHIPLPVLQAIKADKFLPIADLDRGFIRPTYEAQVIVSYMQAGSCASTSRAITVRPRSSACSTSSPRARRPRRRSRRRSRFHRRSSTRTSRLTFGVSSERTSTISRRGRKRKRICRRPSARRTGDWLRQKPRPRSSSTPTMSTKAALTSRRRARTASSVRPRSARTRCSSIGAAAATIPTR